MPLLRHPDPVAVPLLQSVPGTGTDAYSGWVPRPRKAQSGRERIMKGRPDLTELASLRAGAGKSPENEKAVLSFKDEWL